MTDVNRSRHRQPFELGWGRRIAGSGPGLYPQLLLRLGTTVQAAAGVRRPPASVLFTADRWPGSLCHG